MDRASRRALWWRFVDFGFRLLYNELAFTYDAVSYVVSLGAWRCWQRAALGHLTIAPQSRVLELAFGTGNLHLDLHDAGYNVYGHDLSAAMASITRGKFARRGTTAKLTRGYAQKLPYADGVFSAVISTFPTDFIMSWQTLEEVHRVLKPDGQFIIVPNGVFNTEGLPERALEWLYKVTGQRVKTSDEIDGAVEGFFAGYGFDLAVAYEKCPRSIATVIIAKKHPSVLE